MLDIPTKAMAVNGHLLSRFTLELLINDVAECVQIEISAGFLVKVLPPEQDPGACPYELQMLITQARKDQMEWLLISRPENRADYEHLYQH